MGDLMVDIAVLTAGERDLALLKSEFDGIEDRRDDTAEVWGHDGLRDAMHEFASNMKHHREELSASPARARGATWRSTCWVS